MNKNYDVPRYWEARSKVNEARKKIDKLPLKLQSSVKEIVRLAVEGTYLACKEIYDPDPMINRSGDWESDKKDLAKFADKFKKS